MRNFSAAPPGKIVNWVVSCGVCHTDLKVAAGRNRFTPPTVLGHEVAGTVARVGARCEGKLRMAVSLWNY